MKFQLICDKINPSYHSTKKRKIEGKNDGFREAVVPASWFLEHVPQGLMMPIKYKLTKVVSDSDDSSDD